MSVTINSNADPGVTTSGTSLSTSFNNASGARVVAVTTICVEGGSPTITGINYPDPGTPMSQITHQVSNSSVDNGIYEKRSAATGSNTLKASYSGNGVCTLSAISVTGDDSGTAGIAATPTYDNSTASFLDISKVTSLGSGLIACFCAGSAISSMTGDTQVMLKNVDGLASGNNGGAKFKAATGGTDTITCTLPGNDQINAVMIEIPAASGLLIDIGYPLNYHR